VILQYFKDDFDEVLDNIISIIAPVAIPTLFDDKKGTKKNFRLRRAS